MYLTDTAWEKRIRRALNKRGYVLHKSRKRGGGYIVFDPALGDEYSTWYESLDKLQDLVERLNEA